MTTPAELLGLVAEYPVRTFSAGEVLLEEGSRAGVLYVLEAGMVEVSKGGQSINQVQQPGAVFGEVSVLMEQPHMATVRAATEARCRVIAEPREFFRSHPVAALHVATTLARRLSAVTSYLVDLKRQYEDRQDHLGMVDQVLESLLQLQPKPARGGAAATDAGVAR